MAWTDAPLAAVSSRDTALFALLVILVVLALLGLFLFGIWKQKRPPCLSPYSRQPLQPASGMSYEAAGRVLRFLYNMHQYDNRIFDLSRAAICRETGRIFPDAVNWYNAIRVDWGFLQKRYPGEYVSWGCLTDDQKMAVAALHDSLEGFQTEFSSPNPQPRAIEAKYALAKPGPLYVDIRTNVLLGWKIVPGTELEVMVVQKPVHVIMPSTT